MSVVCISCAKENEMGRQINNINIGCFIIYKFRGLILSRGLDHWTKILMKLNKNPFIIGDYFLFFEIALE